VLLAAAGRSSRCIYCCAQVALSLLVLLLLLLLQGVSWSHSCAKWVAVIWDRLLRKARHLGVFEGEEEAARAYDQEVVRLQGSKNTGLNFRDSELLSVVASCGACIVLGMKVAVCFGMCIWCIIIQRKLRISEEVFWCVVSRGDCSVCIC
jgi:hypothetical protein